MVLRAVNGHLLNVGGHLVANDDCCCGEECQTPCDQCTNGCGPPCFFVEVHQYTSGSGAYYGYVARWVDDCCWLSLNGLFGLSYYGGNWVAHFASTLYHPCNANWSAPGNCAFNAVIAGYVCSNGGTGSDGPTQCYDEKYYTCDFTVTPYSDCDDCPEEYFIYY